MTSLVERALREADDYVTPAALVKITGANINQVSAACSELYNYKVVDFIANDNGVKTHWFALPPESDQRIRKHHERKPESKKRKPRKPKGKDHVQ